MKFRFDDQTSFAFDYHHMLSQYEGNKASGYTSGSGKTRGDLFIAKLMYDINKNLSGHLIFEHFKPGNYYFSGADASNWARMEVLFKI
jgi:hypothetical protein